MLFISLPFVVFFILFFLLYWYVFSRSARMQNLLALAASYLFYAWWDWRFLFLLAGTSLVSYFLGLGISHSKSKRIRGVLLGIGLAQGPGCLLFFKYYNFFAASLGSTLAAMGLGSDIHTLNIILPLGISFYTFRALSYLLDIKSGKIKATIDWVVFFSYIAFFPCLLAGPIDRPKTMIPQLEKKREFNYSQATDGMRQILWGLFKKAVIADNCAAFVNPIFSHYQTYPSSALLCGAFLFTIQVYADFSGYSDMAIGLSNLIGIKVTRNFNYPFFTVNIADFWRRWHISLTGWFTDYIFTPLSIALRDYGKAGLILAILINFILIGAWHGASLTFIVFGFVNGLLFIPLILKGTLNKARKKHEHKDGSGPVKLFLSRTGTFLLVMLTFIIFRADSLSHALGYYHGLFSLTAFSGFAVTERINFIVTFAAIVLMLCAEWVQRDKQHALQLDFISRPAVRGLIYLALIFLVLSFSPTKNADFIYFKF